MRWWQSFHVLVPFLTIIGRFRSTKWGKILGEDGSFTLGRFSSLVSTKSGEILGEEVSFTKTQLIALESSFPLLWMWAWTKETQPKTFGTRLVDVIKFGKHFEKILIGLLNPKTLNGNRFIRWAIVNTVSP